jgi:TonB family protein
MEAIITYLFRSTVWLTGFALVYLLFLRNERFFVLNRIYLASGILVSIICPLFTWHYTVVLPVVPMAEVFEPQMVGTVVVSEPFPIQTILLYIYLAGAAYLLFRVIRQTAAVVKIIRKSEIHSFSSAKLIRTADYPASFSFFSFVFVNPSIDETETNEIVNHEQEHIRQRHWIDLLLFEMLCTIQWFNPVSWLYGRFIRQNHEYLADEAALRRTSNPAIYRAALLNQMFGGPVIQLANSFNYSLNKKRFNMMKQIINSPIRKLKLLLVVPLMAGVFYAFAAPEYKFVQNENGSSTEAVNGSKVGKTVTGKVVREDGVPLSGATIIVSGKTLGTVTDANGNFKLEMPDNSPLVISYVGFETVILPSEVVNDMPIKMKTKTFNIELDSKPTSTANEAQTQKEMSKALIMVDGKEITREEMEKINPESIESVSVLKDKSAVSLYGEKAKDGAVLIKLKSGVSLDDTQKSSAAQTFKVQANAPFKFTNQGGSEAQPLIVKDGVVVENKDIQNISPETIESITVLKNESATAMFGEKGKNGVILIAMKKDGTTTQNGTTDVKVVGYANDQKENKPNSGINIRSTGTSGTKDKPLIVIDGVIAENQNMDKIDPETIESVNILKDESATSKYGEKGKNGVVQVTTKKAEEVFVVVEEMPEFPGGDKAMRQFLAMNVRYPTSALESNIQGKVYVTFIVTKTGTVTNAKVVRSVDPSLDNEAIRVIEAMPKWKPGRQRGENVDVSFTVPITFMLQSNKASKEEVNTKEKQADNTFVLVEEMPEFPGGIDALRAYIQGAIKYPAAAFENGIQGKVYVRFVVTKTGGVANATIARSVDPILDKEAIRVVEAMPNWKPGKQNGQNVDVYYTVPVNFQLPGAQSETEKKSATISKTAESEFKTQLDQVYQIRKLIIVPNPTSDIATVSLEGSDSSNKLDISIYDKYGKLIKSESKNGPSFTLSFANFTSGTYLIVAKDGANQFTGQLVVNH